jgi:hypothetical protein
LKNIDTFKTQAGIGLIALAQQLHVLIIPELPLSTSDIRYNNKTVQNYFEQLDDRMKYLMDCLVDT